MIRLKAISGVLCSFVCFGQQTDWVQQIKNKPSFDVRQYNFAPQAPSGTLTAATPATATLSPVPLGLNGSDVLHWLRIPTCSGGAQTVLITGGTATSGSTSGTVTFTPVNSCTAGWTIQSATGGITEALEAAVTAGGGRVTMPAGTISVYSDIFIQQNVSLAGTNRTATKLRIPNGVYSGGPEWRNFGFNPSGMVISAGVGVANVSLSSFTIDMNGATQPSAPNGSYGIEFVNVNNSLIQNVEVDNCPILTSGNTCLPIGVLGTSSNNVVDGNFVLNQVCSTSSEGAGGFIVGGKSNRITSNYVSNGCNTAYVTGGTDTIFENNVFELAGSTMVAAAQAFASDNAVGARFIGNNCLGNGTGPACFSVTTDAASPDTLDTVLEGNLARNCGQGFQMQSTTATSRRVMIIGGSVVNCTTPLSITGTIDRITIEGVSGLFMGHGDAVVQLSSLTNGANQNLAITDAGVLRVGGPSAGFSIGGFQNGFDGRHLEVFNASTQQMTINNSDAGSTAANRICTLTGGSVVLPARDSVAKFTYSTVDACWVLTGTY